MKKCKYCKSEMANEAKVCPTCRKDQRVTNNPLWLIPIGLVICFIVFLVFSSKAPLKVREFFCGIGLRSGYPYCYYYSWEKD